MKTQQIKARHYIRGELKQIYLYLLLPNLTGYTGKLLLKILQLYTYFYRL